MPFGFPSGAGLKTKIVELLGNRNGTLWSISIDLGFSPERIDAFQDALKHSGKRSVDAFLEHRAEFVDLGKVATAYVIMSCELKDQVFADRKENWYQYFFNKLNVEFDDFGKNHVSVITFNYDRSLEFYLVTALQNSYGKIRTDCLAKLTALPMVHLYGDLGTLPTATDRGAAFGAGLNHQTVRKGAEGIRIIHEPTTEATFQEAYKLLDEAERIVFVGFGYDPTNMDRLFKGVQARTARVVGSAMGFTRSELNFVQSSFARLSMRNVELEDLYSEALEFLRHHSPFD